MGLQRTTHSAAVVLDHRTGEQVAELHGRVPPDRFGHLLDALGRYYNRAVLAVERNNHGHSTLNTLRNVCNYPPPADSLLWPPYSAGLSALPTAPVCCDG